MSRAKSIVEAAVFTALAARVTVAKVYQDAPQDEQGDLVIIGDLASARMPGKDAGDDRRVTVTIAAIAIGEERAPLLAIQEQCDDALDEQTLELDGWTLHSTFVDDDAVLSDDGETYVGLAKYEVLALAP